MRYLELIIFIMLSLYFQAAGALLRRYAFDAVYFRHAFAEALAGMLRFAFLLSSSPKIRALSGDFACFHAFLMRHAFLLSFSFLLMARGVFSALPPSSSPSGFAFADAQRAARCAVRYAITYVV